MNVTASHTHINPSPLLPKALSLHQQAFQAKQRGDYATAERLWIEVLAIKDAIMPGGADSEGSALTRNAMGELYLKMGRYDEAEELLKKAVSVRERVGNAFDAAMSRENLAQVYEHKGDLALARATRVSVPNSMVCGYENCPKPPVALSNFKACSGCKSIFYCSKACQITDWKPRHKALCKPVSSK